MPIFIRLAATSSNMTLMAVFPACSELTTGSTADLQNPLQIIAFYLFKISFPPLQARVCVALRAAPPAIHDSDLTLRPARSAKACAARSKPWPGVPLCRRLDLPGSRLDCARLPQGKSGIPLLEASRSQTRSHPVHRRFSRLVFGQSHFA